MAASGKITGIDKMNLVRDLADNILSQSQIAEKYNVTQGAISQFKGKHQALINEALADQHNEFRGLLYAKKANRLAAYERQIDYIEAQLESNPNHPKLGTLLRYYQNAIRSIAEELGALTQKVETQANVKYSIDGVDMEKMK